MSLADIYHKTSLRMFHIKPDWNLEEIAGRNENSKYVDWKIRGFSLPSFFLKNWLFNAK